MKQEKKRPLNNGQKIIQKFVTVEFSKNQRGFWPAQMKIAVQLIKKYGIEFLLWCPKPNNYKVTSLVWFLTSAGQGFLSDQLVEYTKSKIDLSPKQSNITVTENKIGQDIEITSKPKTLKDFLNYGKKT